MSPFSEELEKVCPDLWSSVCTLRESFSRVVGVRLTVRELIDSSSGALYATDGDAPGDNSVDVAVFGLGPREDVVRSLYDTYLGIRSRKSVLCPDDRTGMWKPKSWWKGFVIFHARVLQLLTESGVRAHQEVFGDDLGYSTVVFLALLSEWCFVPRRLLLDHDPTSELRRLNYILRASLDVVASRGHEIEAGPRTVHAAQAVCECLGIRGWLDGADERC